MNEWMNEWKFNDTPARKTDRLLGVSVVNQNQIRERVEENILVLFLVFIVKISQNITNIRCLPDINVLIQRVKRAGALAAYFSW